MISLTASSASRSSSGPRPSASSRISFFRTAFSTHSGMSAANLTISSSVTLSTFSRVSASLLLVMSRARISRWTRRARWIFFLRSEGITFTPSARSGSAAFAGASGGGGASCFAVPDGFASAAAGAGASLPSR